MVIDTDPRADARYHELLRAQPPHARLARAVALSRSARELAVAGVRARHPSADDAEVRVRLAVRLYGRDLAVRVYGAVPEDAV